jgi:hypothetical protein
MIKIKKEVIQKTLFIETHLEADYQYFIDNINIGIKNSPQNFTTNVLGFMTPWDYFKEDEKFLEQIAIPSFNIIEDDEDLTRRWQLGNCWGTKQSKSHYTKRHSHPQSVYTCVFYLNDDDNNLIIPKLDREVVPKKGKLIIFNGFLDHRTRRIVKDKERYSIAFNLDYLTISN